jgi:hypothetical protein
MVFRRGASQLAAAGYTVNVRQVPAVHMASLPHRAYIAEGPGNARDFRWIPLQGRCSGAVACFAIASIFTYIRRHPCVIHCARRCLV